MKLIQFVLIVVLFALTVFAETKQAPTQLQIGVKKAIPADQCKRKTKGGDQLSMHYTGTLFSTGKKFDSSLDRNQPFEFKLGSGQVIKGWDQGLLQMCIGEKRKLTIPPSLGYGDRAMGDKIPAGNFYFVKSNQGSTLVFEVELLDIKNKNEDL